MSRYQIRNRFREIVGEFSEREILKAIQKGKYSGEEEISLTPFDDWSKLAAHPKFYDAFLKRLYNDSYESPDGETPDEPSKPKEKKKATRASKEAGLTKHQKDAAEPHTKTKQGKEHADVGATMHQKDIDDLFSDHLSDQKRKKERSLALVPMNEAPEPDVEIPATAMHGKLDIAVNLREEESPEVVKRRKNRERRRKLVIGAVAALALVLLFQLGGSGDPKGLFPEVEEAEGALYSPKFDDDQGRSAKVTSLLNEGLELFAEDGRLFYKEALDIFSEAHTIDEANAQVIGRLALSQARLLAESTTVSADQKRIASWVEAGRRSDPQSPLFYQAEAIIALNAGRVEEARTLVSNAQDADPANPETALLQGEILYRAGEFSPAEARLIEAAKSSVAAVRAHYFIAQIAFERHDMLKAKSEALEALKLNPFHAPTYYVLADVASAQNEWKDAKSFYETCGRLALFGSKPLAAKAYYRLGTLQELSGTKDQSDRAFRLSYYYDPEGNPELKKKVKDLDTSKKNLLALAQEAEFAESYLEIQADSLKDVKLLSSKFMQAAQVSSPADGRLLVKYGQLMEKRASSYADFQKIMNIYERAIRRDPSNAEAYIQLGLLETDQYNLKRGFTLLQKAQALAPEDAAPYVALGKHYFRRQDYNEALNQFLTAAKLNPSDSEILYYAGLLRVTFKKESAKDAMRFFYQAYTLNPSNYDALVEWLKLKVLNHEKTFAVKFIRNLVEGDPQNAALHWAYGEIYAANNEYFRSITHFHQSLDLDNRASKVRMALAKALESVGELEKAVSEYRLASVLDPRNGDGSFQAARILGQMKDFNRAEEVLKGLIAVTPNYPGVHRELAQVHRARKQEGPAIAAMEREVGNNPRNMKFRLELGELYMEYKKFDKGLESLAVVTNLPPVSKAPEFVYDKIRAYLLMSRAYRAVSKFENAEGAIKLALELDTEDPELHRELGYVYHGMQRDKEAVKAFEFYLGRNPAAEDAMTIKGLINQMRIE